MKSDGYEARADQFERKIVLRVSRSIYLAFAGLATLSLVGAIVVVFYGLTPSVRGFDPPEPERPETQAVSPAEVLAAMEEEAADDVVVERWSPDEDLRTAIKEGLHTTEDPTSARLEALLTQIEGLFDSTKFPWQSKTKSVCGRKDWYGDCVRWEKRVSQRGVLTLLDRGTQELTPSQRVDLLEGVLSVLKLVDEEETRFLAVRAVTDMRAAYERPAGTSLAALVQLFDRAPTDRVVLVEVQKAQVLEILLEIRKRDTPEQTLTAFLPAVPRLAARFSPEGAVAAVGMSWVVIGGLPVAEVPQRLAELEAALDAAPADLRAPAIETFGEVLEGKNLAARLRYEGEVGDRRRKIAETDSRYATKKELKGSARALGMAGILSALATIAVIGLLLGLLAVERNTRLLRDVIDRLGLEGAGSVASVADVVGSELAV